MKKDNHILVEPRSERNEYLQNMTVEDMLKLHSLGKDIVLNDGQVIAVL